MKTYIVTKASKKEFQTKCGESFELTAQGFRRRDGKLFILDDTLGPDAPTVFRVGDKEYRSSTEA